MPNRPSKLLALTALSAALTLAACSRGQEEGNLAALDNQLTTSNDADPALTSALQDQIAVDPQLAQQSNRNAVRPPETPTQAQYPTGQSGGGAPAQAGTGAPATAGSPGNGGAGGNGGARPAVTPAGAPAGGGANLAGNACLTGAGFSYNMAWAQRLSPTFPVYPGGRVTDAAGNDQNGCSARVVTFVTGDNPQRVLDWYNTQAVRAGYTSEHQLREGDHILAGANQRGAAYYLIVTPRQRGAEVALIANGA
jgi:hypothetical protein